MRLCACRSLTSALAADSMDTDICHQGPVRCDKAGHITDLVLQGTNTDMDLTCPAFSEGFAQLPELQRIDLAGANLGACAVRNWMLCCSVAGSKCRGDPDSSSTVTGNHMLCVCVCLAYRRCHDVHCWPHAGARCQAQVAGAAHVWPAG